MWNSLVATQPPSNAPAMPIRQVIMSPCDLRPGMNILAMRPAPSPRTIQARIPMTDSFSQRRHDARGSSVMLERSRRERNAPFGYHRPVAEASGLHRFRVRKKPDPGLHPQVFCANAGRLGPELVRLRLYLTCAFLKRGQPAVTQTHHVCRRASGSPAVGRGESTGGA